MTDNYKTHSKFLSYVLRHKPESIGIALDKDGWVDIDILLAASAAAGRDISSQRLIEIVATNDKQRFAFDQTGTRIRANQGHSVDIDLGLTAVQPPAALYHGTVEKFIASIAQSGLVKMNRQYVHLSATIETAQNVGSRRGKPLILKVRAADMAAAGYVFFRSENGVWLTDAVPPEFLDRS